MWKKMDALITDETPLGTFAGEYLPDQSYALGMLHKLGFGALYSYLQYISTAMAVQVWQLRKGGMHSRGGPHVEPRLETQY
jgi:hypothetical protein